MLPKVLMKAGGLVVIIAAGVALLACQKHEPKPVPKPQSHVAPAPQSIAWFDGSVEAAFERARSENKPVFLYWGAQWCPPCHQLKATVFSRPDFIEKSKLFIPVYLDGDTAGAQKWGDVFHVSGYPTVVVLSADRSELARIAGGMDLSQYSEVLDLVLSNVKPVNAILASLDNRGTQLSVDDCRRLAYNGWPLDDVSMEAPDKTAGALQRTSQACPAEARTERARLLLAATYASLQADSAALKAEKPPSARTTQLVGDVFDLLANQELSLAAGDSLRWLGDEFFTAFKRVYPKRAAELRGRWVTAMDAMDTDSRFTEADQLEAIAEKLDAIKILSVDEKIPEPVATAARTRVDAALAKTYADHARPGVVNSALWVLHYLDDKDRSMDVLMHEVQTAQQPYYYMLDLADLEEQRGHQDEAIHWLERAYNESQGAATRFQWGTDYVFGLIRMRPQDAKHIQDTTINVLSELDGPDRIYMRTAHRLKTLDRKLREWNKNGAHAATITAARKRMDDICGKIPKTEPARQSCDVFLAKAS